MASANLYAFRDLDLMLRIEDEADDEGWVETENMARALGFGDSRRNVGIRFAWMKRYGMLEFDQQKRMWRLTDSGRRVTQARIQAATANGIEKLPDEAMIDVMAKVTQRYMYGSQMIGHLLRREFMFGTQPRR